MTTDRTEYTKGLRDLATLLDNHPELPLPHRLSNDGLQWFGYDIETVLALRARIEDALTLPYDSVQGNFPVEITGTLAGFPASVLVAREIALDGAPAYPPPPPMNPRLLATDTFQVTS